ncbi:MAG: LapA family protein [Candidatus Marinimicrobia bacterium]|nr:LapA family protein [Candidatus Neomarinimicrobiota bacterium]
MKMVKIFAGLVVMIIVLYFLMQNTNIVSVDLIFAQYENVQVAVVMLGALTVGMLIGYGVALTNILSGKSELRSLKTKNRRLSDELNDLRNVAIDEGIYDTEDGDI